MSAAGESVSETPSTTCNQREIYQAPACIDKPDRHIKLRHVYTNQTDLSSSGMYIQKQTASIYRAGASICLSAGGEDLGGILSHKAVQTRAVSTCSGKAKWYIRAIKRRHVLQRTD